MTKELPAYYRAYFDEQTNEMILRGLAMTARPRPGDEYYTPRLKISFTFDDGCTWGENETFETIVDRKLLDDLFTAFERYEKRASAAINKRRKE